MLRSETYATLCINSRRGNVRAPQLTLRADHSPKHSRTLSEESARPAANARRANRTLQQSHEWVKSIMKFQSHILGGTVVLSGLFASTLAQAQDAPAAPPAEPAPVAAPAPAPVPA